MFPQPQRSWRHIEGDRRTELPPSLFHSRWRWIQLSSSANSLTDRSLPLSLLSEIMNECGAWKALIDSTLLFLTEDEIFPDANHVRGARGGVNVLRNGRKPFRLNKVSGGKIIDFSPRKRCRKKVCQFTLISDSSAINVDVTLPYVRPKCFGKTNADGDCRTLRQRESAASRRSFKNNRKLLSRRKILT